MTRDECLAMVRRYRDIEDEIQSLRTEQGLRRSEIFRSLDEEDEDYIEGYDVIAFRDHHVRRRTDIDTLLEDHPEAVDYITIEPYDKLRIVKKKVP